MDGMEVRMITDRMFFQCVDHVPSTTMFEHAGFLAHELEGGTNTSLGKHFGKPLGGIVICRQQIIFGIEPQQHINAASRHRRRCAEKQHCYQADKMAMEFSHNSDRSFV